MVWRFGGAHLRRCVQKPIRVIFRVLQIISAVGLILCVLVGVPAFALAGLYSLKFGACVRLPNDTEIGYEAYVDFSRPYLFPEVVLREPDGSVIAKEVSPIHVTETATLGTAWPDENSARPDFTFIWTAETGLVKEAENSELYLHLSQDLGETYYGASKDMNTNILWLFNRLLQEGQFRNNHCKTSLWTW